MSFLRALLRRTLAVALSTTILVTTVEPAIADVHDGDASPAELAAAGTAAAPFHALQFQEQDAQQDGAQHDAHVCHAGHAHVIWVGLPILAPGILASFSIQTDDAPQPLISHASAPDVPPPVA